MEVNRASEFTVASLLPPFPLCPWPWLSLALMLSNILTKDFLTRNSDIFQWLGSAYQRNMQEYVS